MKANGNWFNSALIVFMAAFLLMSAAPAQADLLDDIKARGVINIGVAAGAPGFSATNNEGVRIGFDIDLCHALAAAVLGDPNKLKLVPVSAKEGFPALQTGSIDVIVSRLTFTLTRDAASMDFPKVMIYDGQGFLVPKDLGIKKLADLNGATICANAGSTSEQNVTDYFRKNNMKFQLLTFKSGEESLTAYAAKRCDCFTTDSFGLAAQSLKLPDRDKHVILPERISKEPIGPIVAHGQNRWNDVVAWVMNALIDAEEAGVTKANVDEMKKSDDPDIQRLLGVNGDMGKALGLPNDWAYQAVKAVGNYGEIFERNLGQGSPLKIERGYNALWNKGGLMIGMPIR